MSIANPLDAGKCSANFRAISPAPAPTSIQVNAASRARALNFTRCRTQVSCQTAAGLSESRPRVNFDKPNSNDP